MARNLPTKVVPGDCASDGESFHSVFGTRGHGIALKTEPPAQTATAIRQVHHGQLVFRRGPCCWLVSHGQPKGAQRCRRCQNARMKCSPWFRGHDQCAHICRSHDASENTGQISPAEHLPEARRQHSDEAAATYFQWPRWVITSNGCRSFPMKGAVILPVHIRPANLADYLAVITSAACSCPITSGKWINAQEYVITVTLRLGAPAAARSRPPIRRGARGYSSISGRNVGDCVLVAENGTGHSGYTVMSLQPDRESGRGGSPAGSRPCTTSGHWHGAAACHMSGAPSVGAPGRTRPCTEQE